MIAVIFTSQLNTLSIENQLLYNSFNDELEVLVSNNNGFIKQTSCRNENGFGISISYWKDYESARAFKNQTRHIEAQKNGRQFFYEWYDVKIAEVNKEYSFNLPQ